MTVRLCVPEIKDDVLKFTFPPIRESVASVLAPSMRVTVPVGIPLNCGVIMTVKVTDTPCKLGFAED
jgi:hypothetical protein